MIYKIYKVTANNSGTIQANLVHDNALLDMNDGQPKKFTFVKASDLDIITNAADYTVTFKYKDKL